MRIITPNTPLADDVKNSVLRNKLQLTQRTGILKTQYCIPESVVNLMNCSNFNDDILAIQSNEVRGVGNKVRFSDANSDKGIVESHMQEQSRNRIS
jgi:hypothetical protein